MADAPTRRRPRHAARRGARRATGRAGPAAVAMVERGGDARPGGQPGRPPARRRRHTVGITGAPGAGKSTLTSALVGRDPRRRATAVAVLAIDPSSPFTGGAILGDRVRMGEHALDDGVFIRSMATRGHLGGLALATPEAVRVLDAAGLAVGADRDGRRRPGRGRGRRRGRHHRRGGQPGLGRRGAGQQGRADGDRRHLRDQQGRPARAPTRPVATSTRCSSSAACVGRRVARRRSSTTVAPTRRGRRRAVGARSAATARTSMHRASWLDAAERPPHARSCATSSRPRLLERAPAAVAERAPSSELRDRGAAAARPVDRGRPPARPTDRRVRRTDGRRPRGRRRSRRRRRRRAGRGSR